MNLPFFSLSLSGCACVFASKLMKDRERGEKRRCGEKESERERETQEERIGSGMSV